MKIKSGGFRSFHVGDAQDNFLGVLSLIILLGANFFLKKIQKNCQLITNFFFFDQLITKIGESDFDLIGIRF